MTEPVRKEKNESNHSTSSSKPQLGARLRRVRHQRRGGGSGDDKLPDNRRGGLVVGRCVNIMFDTQLSGTESTHLTTSMGDGTLKLPQNVQHGREPQPEWSLNGA